MSSAPSHNKSKRAVRTRQSRVVAAIYILALPRRQLLERQPAFSSSTGTISASRQKATPRGAAALTSSTTSGYLAVMSSFLREKMRTSPNAVRWIAARWPSYLRSTAMAGPLTPTFRAFLVLQEARDGIFHMVRRVCDWPRPVTPSGAGPGTPEARVRGGMPGRAPRRARRGSQFHHHE